MFIVLFFIDIFCSKMAVRSTTMSLDAAMNDVEARFLYNLPENELTSPERLFFQIEQAYWFYGE